MSLTMDDLIGTCPDCGGTGKRPEENKASGGGNSYGFRTVTYALGTNAEDCARCAGTGRWGLTEAGRTVGKFVGIFQKLKERGLDG
jgi:DnaJ-class molecular chaperone